MEYLIATIISLLCGLVIAMMLEKGKRASGWLIRVAAGLYGEDRAPRYQEEWEAHLLTLDGPLSMLTHGFGCVGTGLIRGWGRDHVLGRLALISTAVLLKMTYATRVIESRLFNHSSVHMDRIKSKSHTRVSLTIFLAILFIDSINGRCALFSYSGVHWIVSWARTDAHEGGREALAFLARRAEEEQRNLAINRDLRKSLIDILRLFAFRKWEVEFFRPDAEE